MKYRVKTNPDIVVEAFKWDPTKPASQRPAWFNDKVTAGEAVIETNDSVSLPFPATSSIYPGDIVIKRHDNGELIPGRPAFMSQLELIEG